MHCCVETKDDHSSVPEFHPQRRRTLIGGYTSCPPSRLFRLSACLAPTMMLLRMQAVLKALVACSAVGYSPTVFLRDIVKSISIGRRCLRFSMLLSSSINSGLVGGYVLHATIQRLSTVSTSGPSKGRLSIPSKRSSLSRRYSTSRSLHSGSHRKRTSSRMLHHGMTLRS